MDTVVWLTLFGFFRWPGHVNGRGGDVEGDCRVARGVVLLDSSSSRDWPARGLGVARSSGTRWSLTAARDGTYPHAIRLAEPEVGQAVARDGRIPFEEVVKGNSILGWHGLAIIPGHDGMPAVAVGRLAFMNRRPRTGVLCKHNFAGQCHDRQQ